MNALIAINATVTPGSFMTPTQDSIYVVLTYLVGISKVSHYAHCDPVCIPNISALSPYNPFICIHSSAPILCVGLLFDNQNISVSKLEEPKLWT